MSGGLKFLSVVNYILAWLLSTLLSKDKTHWHQFFPQKPLLSSCSLLNQVSDSCSFPQPLYSSAPACLLHVCYHTSPTSAGPGYISMLNEHQVWVVWWASVTSDKPFNWSALVSQVWHFQNAPYLLCMHTPFAWCRQKGWSFPERLRWQHMCITLICPCVGMFGIFWCLET